MLQFDHTSFTFVKEQIKICLSKYKKDFISSCPYWEKGDIKKRKYSFCQFSIASFLSSHKAPDSQSIS